MRRRWVSGEGSSAVFGEWWRCVWVGVGLGHTKNGAHPIGQAGRASGVRDIAAGVQLIVAEVERA